MGVSNIKHISLSCHPPEGHRDDVSVSEGSLRSSARFFAAKNKSAAQNDIGLFLLSSILDIPYFLKSNGL